MFTKNINNAIEIELISKNKLNNYIKENPDQRRWIEQNTFAADPGELVIVPQDKDNIRKVLLGKTNENDVYSKFICSNFWLFNINKNSLGQYFLRHLYIGLKS